MGGLLLSRWELVPGRPSRVKIVEDDGGAVTELPSPLPRGYPATLTVAGAAFVIIAFVANFLHMAGVPGAVWITLAGGLGGLLSAAYLWVRHHTTKLSLNPATLRIERAGEVTFVPLEEIRHVEVVLEGFDGHLLVRAATADHPVGVGLFEHELLWLRDWLLGHVARRRQALLDEGIDPDALPRAPEELLEIRSRS